MGNIMFNKPNKGKTADVILAATNTPNALKIQADYVCNGVNDDVSINSLINSLRGEDDWTPASILFQPGNYIINDTITVTNNRKLYSTAPQGANFFWVENPSVNKSMFLLDGGNIQLDNLGLNGFDVGINAPYPHAYNGIEQINVDSMANIINNCYLCGFANAQILGNPMRNTRLIYNHIENLANDDGGYGIKLTNTSKNNIILGNHLYNVQNGIYLDNTTQSNILSSNGFVSGVGINITDLGLKNAIDYISSKGTGTTAPTTGTWKKGDMVYNSNPTATSYLGWICVTAGTPGTWKGFGLIQS